MNESRPDQDPQADEQVRSLLAAAGSSSEPLPADVAARLDETLAGLVAEREAEELSAERSASGTVVPLRPRWMPRAAAAAAAVIVLGLGGIAVANLGHLGGSESKTTSDAGGGTALQEQAPSASAPGDSADKAGQAPGTLPQLAAATFPRDVGALLREQPALRARARLQAEDSTGTLRSPSAGPYGSTPACAGPAVTDGSTVSPVSLDSEPAALVVHPPQGQKRLVEAWSCDGGHRLATATIAR